MTADESRAVIDLWQSERVEQTGLTDKPAVPDVAESLDITVEDVQRLLLEVRARRKEESRLLAQEQILAQAEQCLAEEEASLTELRRERAELRHQMEEDAWRNAVPWQPPKAASHARRRKPRQHPPVEWTGTEDFWQETAEDAEYRALYRANRVKKAASYGLMGTLIALPLGLVLIVLYELLIGLFSR